MSKYHFNSETGRVGQCRATKKGCPLGGEAPHFDTKEEAKKYVEQEAKNSNESFTKISKKTGGKKSGKIDEITEAKNRFKVNMMQFEEEYQGNRNMDTTYGDGSYRTGEQLKKIADEFEKSNFSDEALAKFNSELADIAAATDLASRKAFEANDYNESEYMDGAQDMVNRFTEIYEEYDNSTFWAKKRKVQQDKKDSINS